MTLLMKRLKDRNFSKGFPGLLLVKYYNYCHVICLIAAFLDKEEKIIKILLLALILALCLINCFIFINFIPFL